MKTFSIFLLVFILISCSKTNDERAKIAIKKYLDATLNDPKSYESVSFETLIKCYPFETERKGLASLWKRMDSLNFEYQKLSHSNEYEKQMELLRNMGEVESNINLLQIEKIKEDTTKPQNGWKVKHKYRAKNEFGAIVLQETVFRLSINYDTATKYVVPILTNKRPPVEIKF